ncbi:hypothetical protein FTUN_6612 [Frigoriglobus tundricola]|uniref:Uncharacterized protein n=1 Tax=Frigoriglobus tundricola TaxID=2774151 RepID=A0A6M5YZY3_9BACT|nr:hypothetical protein FTUN_6612 [Frigoriglobus tundricola]
MVPPELRALVRKPFEGRFGSFDVTFFTQPASLRFKRK